MLAVIEVTMAPANKKTGKSGAKKVGEEPQLDPTTTVAIYRDLARWIKILVIREENRMKDKGELPGKLKYGAAKLIDPVLRQWVYSQLWVELGKGTRLSDAPKAPEPMEPDPERLAG